MHTLLRWDLFNNKNYFDPNYKGGLFVAQHGSWNRRDLSGYKVVFVPFENGKPSGPMQDFLTGFIADEGGSRVYGRPVGLSLLMTDRCWLLMMQVTGYGGLLELRSDYKNFV